MGIQPVTNADALARRVAALEGQVAAILKQMQAPAVVLDRNPPADGELFDQHQADPVTDRLAHEPAA